MILKGLNPIALTLTEDADAIEAFDMADQRRPPLGLNPGMLLGNEGFQPSKKNVISLTRAGHGSTFPATGIWRLQSAQPLGKGGQPQERNCTSALRSSYLPLETIKVPAALSTTGFSPMPWIVLAIVGELNPDHAIAT